MRRSRQAVIRFDGVSKKFILHRERPRSFQELAVNLFRHNDGSREEFWALQDVSFTVEQGKTVGIIGPNGAGKSTALKLISRIIEPTSGQIEVNGRVGALLELGAGFHPDLTGRENIYLNGSILGLSRAQIRRKLDEIIAFAELERFIDVPVKHYSSGMYVRLGFSVAVHTDPEILLVDEVLAVGDQNFQHKCLERIMELQRQGVTICFVSHGLGRVRRLCSHAVWLDDGVVRAAGDVEDTISAYLSHAAAEEETRMAAATPKKKTSPPVKPLPKRDEGVKEAEKAKEEEAEETAEVKQRRGTEDVEIASVSFLDAAGRERQVFRVGEPWVVRLHYRASRRIESPVFGLTVHRNDGLHVCASNTQFAGLDIPSVEGEGDVLYRVARLPLMEDTYLVSVSAHDRAGTVKYDYRDRLYTFKVRQVGRGERYGLVSLGGEWEWNDEDTTPPTRRSLERVERVKKAKKRQGTGGRIERRWGAGDVEIVAVSFLDAAGGERRVFEAGEPWGVRLHYRAHRRIQRPVFGLAVHRSDGLHVCGPNTHFASLDIPFVEGEGTVLYHMARLPLMEGTYLVSVASHNLADTVMYDYHDRLYTFKVCQFEEGERYGLVSLGGEWEWNDGECSE